MPDVVPEQSPDSPLESREGLPLEGTGARGGRLLALAQSMLLTSEPELHRA